MLSCAFSQWVKKKEKICLQKVTVYSFRSKEVQGAGRRENLLAKTELVQNKHWMMRWVVGNMIWVKGKGRGRDGHLDI